MTSPKIQVPFLDLKAHHDPIRAEIMAAMAEVIDTTVPGPGGPIPVRIFVPPAARPDWIIYFHGGGGVIGSIRSSEPVTRLLAAQTGFVTSSSWEGEVVGRFAFLHPATTIEMVREVLADTV